MLVEYSCKQCGDKGDFPLLKEAIKHMCPRCGTKEIRIWNDENYSDPNDVEIDNGGYDDEDD